MSELEEVVLVPSAKDKTCSYINSGLTLLLTGSIVTLSWLPSSDLNFLIKIFITLSVFVFFYLEISWLLNTYSEIIVNKKGIEINSQIFLWEEIDHFDVQLISSFRSASGLTGDSESSRILVQACLIVLNDKFWERKSLGLKEKLFLLATSFTNLPIDLWFEMFTSTSTPNIQKGFFIPLPDTTYNNMDAVELSEFFDEFRWICRRVTYAEK